MIFSVGAFLITVLISFILIMYLYFLSMSKFNIKTYIMKWIFLCVTIIMVRILLPINFPFTITILDSNIYPIIVEFLLQKIGSYTFLQIFFTIWGSVSIVKLIYFFLEYQKQCNLLSQIEDFSDVRKTKIIQILEKEKVGNIKVAIIPQKISPVICGLKNPVILIPDFLLEEEYEPYLKYVMSHEIAHYKQYDLWKKFLVEIIICVYWWNPLIYYVKKLFYLIMELSNDALVIEELCVNDRIQYLDAILKVSRECFESNANFYLKNSIGFLNNKSNLEIRIQRIIQQIQQSKNKYILSNFLHISIILVMTLSSIFIVPEAEFLPQEYQGEQIYSITSDNAYMVESEKGYDIYVDNEYIVTIPEKDETLLNIPTYKEKKP